MILYFSSAIPYEKYNNALGSGLISAGHQAQKFNHLLIKGLSKYDDVVAISNPPYNKKTKNETVKSEHINYCISGGSNGIIMRKVANIIHLFKFAYKANKNIRPSFVVVDAVNLGASIVAKTMSILTGVKVIGIVTDIPEIMCKGKMNLFSSITAKLMKKMDGYVLLTNEMNNIVNPYDRPYIIMEGSCDIINADEKIKKELHNKRKVCLFTGSLGETTGVGALIKAFQTDKLSEIELHIYGNGAYAHKLKEISMSSKNIHYFGTITNDEVVIKQREANLLINPRPSNIDYGAYSFPSKLMEYMASGTPVLTTKLPGIPEEYLDFLYIIEDESTSGMADAIWNSLQKDEAFGKDAQRFVLEKKNCFEQARRIYEFGLKL